MALLLPDARILISGGGRTVQCGESTDQLSAEFFAPPYLFQGPRPTITAAPAQLSYGQNFTVQTSAFSPCRFRPEAARSCKIFLSAFLAYSCNYSLLPSLASSRRIFLQLPKLPSILWFDPVGLARHSFEDMARRTCIILFLTYQSWYRPGSLPGSVSWSLYFLIA